MSAIPLSAAAIVMSAGVVAPGQTYEAIANWVNSKLITAITAATKRVERDGFMSLGSLTKIAAARRQQRKILNVATSEGRVYH